MSKNTNKTKKQEKIWSVNRFLNWKILHYFNKVTGTGLESITT